MLVRTMLLLGCLLGFAAHTATSAVACGVMFPESELTDAGKRMVRMKVLSRFSETLGCFMQDPADSTAEIESFRARGQAGLTQFVAAQTALRERIKNFKGSDTKELTELLACEADLNATIDRIGGARYCSKSHLYWHTDIEAAKKIAAQEGKPILSLRMLGKLTDEYSCANSRFFRTTLYSNEEIATLLRENFVLHWKSVRPVPVVTIDFGDGRVVKRTITGNSIHYVLSADGTVIDGLPGLYSPQEFLKQLQKLEAVTKHYTGLLPEQRAGYLTRFHTAEVAAIALAHRNDLLKISATELSATNLPQVGQAKKPSAAAPTAKEAMTLAMPKGRIESPVLDAITARANKLEAESSEDTWKKIAALHQADSKLDSASVAVIRSENPTAASAGRLAMTKRLVEDPMLRVIRELESSIALDTIRNEYMLHRQLHQWLAEGSAPKEVDALNEQVYAKLFLTPSSDPWLGLIPESTYSALSNNGLQPTATVQAGAKK